MTTAQENKKGFTLIELLIVIAVLGILAVAVLSAINPIEQINRSRDTGKRSDAEQLLSASDRYYATKGYYPWMTDADTGDPTVSPMAELNAADVAVGADGEPMLTTLSGATSELKESFVTRITNGVERSLWIYNDGAAGSSTYICFVPQSRTFEDDSWKRCQTTPTDFPAEACPAAGCMDEASGETATTCYSCLP